MADPYGAGYIVKVGDEEEEVDASHYGTRKNRIWRINR